jgi:hypothetical protein
MRRSSTCSIAIVLMLMTGGVIQAGLFNPPLKNPSFESPSLGAGHTSRWSASIDNWIINTSGNIYLEDGSWFPTPDKINVPKIWDGGYLWQQIGTWDQNVNYVVTMWVGRSDASSAVQVDLYAGGNPSRLPASGYGTINDPAGVGATAITGASAVLTPTVAIGSSQRMSVTLNTGTGRTTGDALWLRILGVSAAGTASYVDDVVVTLAVDPALASSPRPADKATDVPPNVVLGWKPGVFAGKHNVYFGTSSDDINAATAASPRGVLVSQGWDANSFDVGRLELGQTYYWRIDEVNATPDGTVRKGAIWSFTVEPVAYAVTNITATASSFDAGKGPEKTIDGSGLIDDLHGTDTKTMWLSSKTGSKPVWIQYGFDRVYKLYELWVWNFNSEYESIMSLGPKDVTIQYTTNGTDWTTLGDFVLNQGSGTEGYAHNTVLNLGGIAARQVKITVNSGWDAVNQYGLSEVRFFYIPVYAREPAPPTGSTNIDPSVTLSWRAGREAASHNVYVGDDSNAVAKGTAPVVATTNTSYAPAGLQLGTTYYWKIEEVNAAATPSAWAGDVWSFATPSYIIIDDFESYNDKEGTSIFNTWADGYGTTANGSLVGNANPPFAEQTIIHGGSQAMPFTYDNTGTHTMSEATRTFTDAQDWTRAGIKTLALFFRGVATNTAGQPYVKINSTKVSFSGSATATSTALWKQWNIDLTSIGVSLAAVKTLAIGVTSSGTGTLYFDDIRLYKTAPAVVQPIDPGVTNLMAHFTMEGEVKDVSGHGYVGTGMSTAFVDSMPGLGKALQFNGTTAYVDMTASFGDLISTLASSTFSIWVNFTNTGSQWQRVFDFGTGTSVYMFLTSRNGSNTARFAITKTGSGGEATASAPSSLATGWHHVTAVIDASTMRLSLYIDGSLAQGNRTTTVLPKDLGKTTQNWLGRSQYTADPYFNGMIDDFRVYNRVLSEGEIRYLAGDR